MNAQDHRKPIEGDRGLQFVPIDDNEHTVNLPLAVADAIKADRADAAEQYPLRLEIEMSQWENLSHFLEFLRYVKNSAGGGHSFMIAADEDADPPGEMFGKQRAGAVCYIDGDGADKIGRIFLNGRDVSRADAVYADAASDPAPLRAAGVLFVTKDGRVLLTRRTAEGDHEGEWAIPGGKLEGDETPAEAAAREAEEETGRAVDPSELREWTRRVRDGVDYTTFTCSVDDEFEPRLNEEHDAHLWIDRKVAVGETHPRADAEWEESKHPRGQPENAGQFASSSGGSKTSGEEGTEPEWKKQLASILAAEKDKENPKVFYHGTAEQYLSSIKREGITVRDNKNWTGGLYEGERGESVYVTSDLTDAKSYAISAAKMVREPPFDVRPVVLRIEIPESERKKLSEDVVAGHKLKDAFKFPEKIKPEWITGVSSYDFDSEKMRDFTRFDSSSDAFFVTVLTRAVRRADTAVRIAADAVREVKIQRAVIDAIRSATQAAAAR